MTPFVIQNEEQNEWLNQRESERMSWCLADIVNIHGPVGLGGNPEYNMTPSDVIYPDLNPAAPQTLPTEGIPTPAVPPPPMPGLQLPPPSGYGQLPSGARAPVLSQAPAAPAPQTIHTAARTDRDADSASVARTESTAGSAPRTVRPAAAASDTAAGTAAAAIVAISRRRCASCLATSRTEWRCASQLPAVLPAVTFLVRRSGPNTMTRTQLTLLLTCLAALTGCQSLSPKWPAWFSSESKSEITESKFPRPSRIAVIWSPAMLNTPGQKPTRGFGGRVYFYDGQNKPVPVEGQLVVYGYNDNKQNGESKTPDRKFAFTPEQFTSHYAPTELGASYSVWIPWDEVGGEELDISLVPIFTAASGQLVVGQSSKLLLPGTNSQPNQTTIERFTLPPPVIERQAPAAGEGVQQASYQQLPSGLPAPQSSLGLQETSFKLPGTMAERLAKAPPQEVRPRQVNALPTATYGENNGFASNLGPATTAANQGPQGAFHPTVTTQSPPTHYGPSTHPVPSSPGLRPTRGLPPSPPYPATRPYGPPSPHPVSPQTASPGAW